MTTKEQFIEMAKGITRPGIDQMMAWLETTDFYTAPASTRFHGAEEGGLCAHSITVVRGEASIKSKAICMGHSLICDSAIVNGIVRGYATVAEKANVKEGTLVEGDTYYIQS